MNRAAIRSKVFGLVAETLDVDEDAISEDVRFDDLGADSFDLLQLVAAYEDEFELRLDDDSLEDIATVGDAIDAIEKAQ